MTRWHWLFITAFVVLLRLPYFNCPTIHIDEQFYLVVADKWLNYGMVPYVDVWDRKPIGIFAIFAVAVALFKNAIVGYQTIAALFVIATCGVVFRIARMIGDGWIPLLATMIYAVGIMLWEGQGGQTPVFYNLFVVTAVAIMFGLIREGAANRRDIAVGMLSASLLFGLSLQIKYTAVLEAAALSLYVLGVLHQRRIFKLHEFGALTIAMMHCGLVPTVIVGAIYAIHGHWPEFFDANFISIFEKHTWNLNAAEYFRRFRNTSLFGIFFIPLAAYGFWRVVRGRDLGAEGVVLRGVALWLLAAFVGALMFGNPTQHYFLPTVAPMALLGSLGFYWLGQGKGGIGRRIAAIQGGLRGCGGYVAILTVPIIASYVVAVTNPQARGEPADIYAVGVFMKEHRTDGCAFVFNRLPILYYLGDLCVPTKYVFPNHLSEISEVRTPGGQRLKELERVLASTPAMIFVRRPHTADIDLNAIDMVEQTLHDRYALVMERAGHGQLYQVYMPVSRLGDASLP
jgi:hypothetical protein